MPDWGEGWGFVVDVGVTAVANRLLPGSGGVVRMVGAAALAGGAGGAAGQLASGDGDWSDLLGGAVAGAAGGALGYGAGKVMQAGAARATRGPKTALDNFTAAESKVKDAADRLADASRNAKQAAADLKSAKAAAAAAPGSKKLQKAEQQAAAAQKAADTARKDARKALGTARTDKSALTEPTGLKRFVGQHGDNAKLSHWLRALGVGLGSGTGVALWEVNQETGLPGQDPTIEFVWVGDHVRQYPTPPFGPDPMYTATGYGFLLQPAGLPHEVAEWHGGSGNSVATALSENYELFGDPSKKTALDEKVIPRFAPLETATGSGAIPANYPQVVDRLNGAAGRFDAMQNTILNTVLPKQDEITKLGRANIAGLIDGMNRLVAVNPGGNFSELAAKALSDIADNTGSRQQDSADNANTVPDPDTITDNEAVKKLAEELARSRDQGASVPGTTGSTPGDYGLPGIGGTTPPGSILPGIDSTGTGGTDSSRTADALDRAVQAAQSAHQPAPAAPITPGAVPGVNPGGGIGSGLGMGSGMEMLLPMLAQQAMSRNFADQDRDLGRGMRDPDRAIRPPAVQTPPIATPAAVAPTPQVAAPGATPAPHANPAVHAPNTTPGQPGVVAPARVAGEDGKVPYDFPDGRHQRVWPAVAEALDAAFADKEHTDAQTAYAKTTAKWSEVKSLERVDPYVMQTGDVATWVSIAAPADSGPTALPKAEMSTGAPPMGATVGGPVGGDVTPPQDGARGSAPGADRTAIAVVFPADAGGTLEVVVQGELRPFQAELADAAGPLGDFGGFAHPPGVGAAAPRGGEQVPVGAGDPVAAPVV
ncbi:hypothetical protein [Nocardia asteroides]|uniref:hypothetical protein n=1 Tax=Nocardia asteroides TaxID=1824 RepID=UPI001E640361|nr:hypothetical protein [Nocardia asteroides]UGT63358.1 hypothetical protein LTT61_08625 [Nocardia asteroides]